MTQKHLVNKDLGILGKEDDIELWNKIVGNRQIRRFIASKKCQSILIIAGGLGTEVDALVNTYGEDIIKKIWFNDKFLNFTNRIKRKYNKINIIEGDFMAVDFKGKQFDVVLGNPPYQNPGKSKGEKLWYRFVRKAQELTKENGYIGFVTPNSWMSGGVNMSSGKWGVLKDLFAKKQLIESQVSGVQEKYFPKIGIDISYWILENKEVYQTSKIHLADGTIDVDFRETDILSPIPQKTSMSIFDKVVNADNEKFDVKYFQKSTKPGELVEKESVDGNYKYPHWVMGTKEHDNLSIRYLDFQKSPEIEYQKILFHVTSRYWQPYLDMASVGAITQGFALAVDPNTTQEGFRSVFYSKLFTYINKTLQVDKNGCMKTSIVRKLPKLDMSKVWTDKEIYDHFDLTQEERDYIETNS